MPLNEDSLLERIVDEFMLEDEDVDARTELFEVGLLDSMAVAELLNVLEGDGDIEIAPEEITLENIGSVEKMVAFANRKAVTA